MALQLNSVNALLLVLAFCHHHSRYYRRRLRHLLDHNSHLLSSAHLFTNNLFICLFIYLFVYLYLISRDACCTHFGWKGRWKINICKIFSKLSP